MMESLGNNRRDSNHQSSSLLPKHPNQQRREMKEKPILSSLGNIVGRNDRLNVPPKKNIRSVLRVHNTRLGLPVDSLSFAFQGVESDEDDGENYHHRQQVHRTSKVKIDKQIKDTAGQSFNTQQAAAGANVGVWACSSLLTGLSLRDTSNTKQTTVNSKPTVGERARKPTFSNETCKMKKSTSISLGEGLSSFLAKDSESDDDENESLYRTLKHRMATVVPEIHGRSASGIGSKLIQKQLKTRDTRKPMKGEALKKAYAVAGRKYRTHKTKCFAHPSRRLEHQESALCIAAARYEDDSDSSSHQQGNLLSLFQSRLTLSKQNDVRSSEFDAICHQSSESNASAKVTTEMENKLKSKRLMFTSPLPKVDRHYKRRDRKKTPKLKSGLIDHVAEQKVDQLVQEPVVDVIVENKNIQDGKYIDDNDTASSLSDDDSILEHWKHPNNIMMTGFVSPTESMSPIPQSSKDATIEVDTVQPCHESTTAHIPMIDETMDDVPSSCQKEIDTSGANCHESVVCYIPLTDQTIDAAPSSCQIVIDTSKHLDHTMTAMDKIHINDDSEEHSTHQLEKQTDTLMQDVHNIRRSHRARTVTNRFTINDSDGYPKKSQSVKNRQPVRSKSIPPPIDNHLSDQDCVDAGNKSHSSSIKSQTKTEQTVESLKAKAIDKERPRRNRKKTDFYHHKIALEETNKTRSAVVTLPETKAIATHFPNSCVESSNYPDPLTEKQRDAGVQREPSLVVPKEENINAMSITMEEDWSTDQLEQLRDAQQCVDPTSTSFWMDVACIVQGKSASECQAKWFSMTKTPGPKAKSTRVVVVPSHLPVDDMNGDEDDIFQSTPMRGNMFLNSNYYQYFTSVNLPQLPTPSEPSTKIEFETFEQSVDIFAPKLKPASKAFLQRMKRNFTKAEATIATKSKSLHKNNTGKNTKALTEVLRDHDMDINIRLTPGGTLQVKSHVDNDEDDFWDDEYDADEENDDGVNYF